MLSLGHGCECTLCLADDLRSYIVGLEKGVQRLTEEIPDDRCPYCGEHMKRGHLQAKPDCPLKAVMPPSLYDDLAQKR